MPSNICCIFETTPFDAGWTFTVVLWALATHLVPVVQGLWITLCTGILINPFPKFSLRSKSAFSQYLTPFQPSARAEGCRQYLQWWWRCLCHYVGKVVNISKVKKKYLRKDIVQPNLTVISNNIVNQRVALKWLVEAVNHLGGEGWYKSKAVAKRIVYFKVQFM